MWTQSSYSKSVKHFFYIRACTARFRFSRTEIMMIVPNYCFNSNYLFVHRPVQISRTIQKHFPSKSAWLMLASMISWAMNGVFLYGVYI